MIALNQQISGLASSRLLAAIPIASLERIRPFLKSVDLHADEVNYHPEQPIQASYFLTRGLVSLVRAMDNGRSVEIGAFGNEGVTGPDVFFGINHALVECVVRVPGTALRIRSDLLRREVQQDVSVRYIMTRFVLSMFNQIAQTAACNRLHTLEQRFCRWLLAAHDSMQDTYTIPITHESLASLLGVHRSVLSLKVKELEKRAAIRCGRGHLTILNRRSIEVSACECYSVIRSHIGKSFGD